MKSDDYAQMLAKHGIRATANRIVIAEALDRAGRPMSMSELEASIVTIDKSGIYRTLAEFYKRQLVHAIDGGNGEVKYELCRSHHHDVDDDRHAHFYCEECRKTFCLDHVAIPKIDVPDGFWVSTIDYMVKGICPDCVRKRHRG